MPSVPTENMWNFRHVTNFTNEKRLGTQNQDEMPPISGLRIMFDPQNWKTEKPTTRERINFMLMKMKKRSLL